MSPNPAREHPYERVANELRAEILRGDLAPGAKLPSENDLKERFKVSRDTARKGIAQLRMEGLITSHQGKGAFVRERPRVSLRQTGSIYRARRATGEANYNAEAKAQGQVPKQVIREVVETGAPEKVADRFGIEAGAPVVVRRLLFLVDGQPMQLCDSYYERSLAEGTPLAEPKLIKGGANGFIENPDGPIGRRIVQFIEDLDIRMPYPHEIEQLDIPAGVPVAKVMRTAYDSAGNALEVLDSIVPCDRHTFRYVIDVP
ncbi:GntR family transcriptional regulator [Streptomyces sp. NPDC008137]|jgi:GntR family transcriptional regulator|uniref:GntR family transcriptional regulator n=1 Tax=Streptomyces sp. NPDC008137 TaxID=3364813 RepID=UPI0036E1D088